jgi:hypothetical protein
VTTAWSNGLGTPLRFSFIALHPAELPALPIPPHRFVVANFDHATQTRFSDSRIHAFCYGAFVNPSTIPASAEAGAEQNGTNFVAHRHNRRTGFQLVPFTVAISAHRKR